MKILNIRYITSLILCVFLWAKGMAQTDNVELIGKLQNAAGAPIEGVSVLVQEKTQGIFSDKEGKFSVEAAGNDRIVFKKAGYNTVYLAAYEIDPDKAIVLKQSLIDAGDDDIVFIPFGERHRREVTATINTVKDLPQLPLSTLNNALSGRLAGLHIQQTGNRPGTDDATFLIRGRSSYNSGQSPLILVDGVARDFVDMDVNEIEGISVLKDAGSLSWYGMNGANGVIYVTTKRGSASATKVTFDAQGGLQAPVTLTRPLNSYAYAYLHNELRQNDGQAPLYNQQSLIGYYTGSDPYLYPDNNLPDQFLKKASPVQRYVATVSGGNAFARYFTLVSFYDQDGLYKGGNNTQYNSNTNFRRYNFRTNLDLHINKSLDVSLDVGGRVADLNYPRDGNATFLSTIFGTPSNAFPILNPDGSYGGSTFFRSNPLAMLEARGNIADVTRTLLATANIKQKLDKITPGLSLNVFYTYDMTGLYTSGFTQNYEVYAYDPSSTPVYSRFGNQSPLNYAGSAFSGNLRNNEFWTGIDYDRMFGKHGVKFSTRVQRAVSAPSSRLYDKREGVSNRLSYSFNQKYFADVVASYTGSQNFMKGKRFGWFPAISAGWIVSEEDFFKSSKVLDYLKIRGSYGQVGNDAISASRSFAFNNYFSRGGSQYFFGTGFSNVPNTAELILANPNLTWEKARKSNIGFDTYFLNKAFSFSADYFKEVRSDMLTADLSPNILGQFPVQVNAGKAQYEGVEGSLSYTKTINKVTIGLHGNYTHVKSKIISLNEEGGLPSYQRQIGFPIGGVVNGEGTIRRFLISEGLFQTEDEIANAPVQRFSGNVKPGDIRYRDVNQDGFIDNLDFVSTDYSDIPTAYFGFGGSVKYAAFDMSFLFQGVSGRTIQISSLVNYGNANTGYINQFSAHRWTPATAETALYPRLTVNDRPNNTANSDFWLRSGDFLKLKHVELGYTIPANTIKRLKLNSCRFYISGFNLLTFDKLGDLPIDPEMPEAGFISSYPYLTTFALGMNLKF